MRTIHQLLGAGSNSSAQCPRGPALLAYLVSWCVLPVAAGCSSPDLSGSNFQCTSNSDCGPGQSCSQQSGELACVTIEDGPIRIGMTGPLQGPSEDLGNEMQRGMRALLEKVNGEGGVYGREVKLEALNDNYNPDDAVAALRQLIDVQEVRPGKEPDVLGPNGVFAMVGNVGTPTMLETAPVATKNEVIFFGPFTGSQKYLRDATQSAYVYNYRAGYYDETASMIAFLNKGIPTVLEEGSEDYKKILVFAQDDSYGNAGYQGVAQAYNTQIEPLPEEDSITRVTYTRENVDSVGPAVTQAGEYFTSFLAENPSEEKERVAIIMIDTYRPGNRFIRDMKNWINADPVRASRLDPVFMHVSFVGSDSLAEALTQSPSSYTDVSTGITRSYTESVIVTQVVPYYGSEAPGVRQYREDIEAFDRKKPSFTSLEGYLVAKLFVDGLVANGPALSTASFRETLDTQIVDHDLGIGRLLNFSTTNHQASNTVWGSEIAPDGTFTVPYVWDKNEGIVTN